MPINEVRIAHDRDFVGALEKGLLVIEAFGPASPKLTLSEVARRTELTRAAARRYLLTLVRLRYAETDGKLFWLAPRDAGGYALVKAEAAAGGGRRPAFTRA